MMANYMLYKFNVELEETGDELTDDVYDSIIEEYNASLPTDDDPTFVGDVPEDTET